MRICSSKKPSIRFSNYNIINHMKRVVVLIGLLILLISIGVSAGLLKLDAGNLPSFFQANKKENIIQSEKIKITNEESVIIDVVDKVSPSVVTVAIVNNKSLGRLFEINPNDPFNIFGAPGGSQKTEQDIGTGFIVSSGGLIVTNKHVVSSTDSKYKVVTKDDKSFEVQKIFRDPVNDLAILKISASNLTPITIGDSSKLKVGQMAIAIGTALGEFRNTVTVGVISGLGRGITAGSPFEGFVERLDNVIQTDAAINPGNSGGPLLNSGGEVIGINSAVSSDGQNIGFAIPINTVKDALDEFNKTGKFSRPFLGVRYKIITRDLALLNDVPEGAYVQDVVDGSPAEAGGVLKEDIITKMDGIKVTDKDGGLAKVISGKKVGDKVTLEIWRDTETKNITVTLSENTGSN